MNAIRVGNLVAACRRLLLLAALAPLAAPFATAGEVRAVAAGLLEVDGRLVALAGVNAPPPGAVCRADGRDWPCGRLATLALEQRVAGADVRCEPAGQAGMRCMDGDADLSRWLLQEGWARAAATAPAPYAEAQAEARTASLGIWRGGEAGAEWRAGDRNATQLGCDVCAERKARIAPPGQEDN